MHSVIALEPIFTQILRGKQAVLRFLKIVYNMMAYGCKMLEVRVKLMLMNEHDFFLLYTLCTCSLSV